MKIKQFFLWMFLTAVCVCFRTAESQAALNLDGSVYINEENFPDQTFRDYIRSVWDKDGDSRITKDELEKITYIWIDCDDEKATSIEGIEFFSNLQEVAIVGYKNMKRTLKKNKQLRSVYISPGTDKCSYEIESKELEASFPLHQITKLVIRNFLVRDLPLDDMKNLKTLKLEGSFADYPTQYKIKKLDLSSNKKLEQLTVVGFYIAKLDIRKNRKLTYVQVTPGIATVATEEDDSFLYDFWSVPKGIKTKLLLPKKNKIQKLLFFTADKTLDISECNQLKWVGVGENTKIKVSRKWYLSSRGKKMKVQKGWGRVFPYEIKVPQKGKYMYI